MAVAVTGLAVRLVHLDLNKRLCGIRNFGTVAVSLSVRTPLRERPRDPGNETEK